MHLFQLSYCVILMITMETKTATSATPIPILKCFKALEAALSVFEKRESSFLTLITPSSSRSACLTSGLEILTIPRKIVALDRIEQFDEATISQNVISVLDHNLGYDEQVERLKLMPASIKAVFVMTVYVEDVMMELTFHFPHSLIYLESSGTVVAYSRPRLYERHLTAYPAAEYSALTNLGHIQTNFYGQEITAVAFKFPPYSVPDYDNPANNGGFEYDIVATIFDSLNLKMDLTATSDGDWWGGERPPGSGNFSGLTGDLQRGVAEIGWANLYTTEERKQVIDFTDWYLVEPTCILLKRPNAKSGVEILTFPFEWVVWLFSMLLLVALAIYYIIHYYFMPYIAKSLAHLLLYCISVPLKESDVFSHTQQSISLRVVHFCFLLGSLVLSASYSGALISFLSVDVYPSMPETYDEVANEVVEKDLKVALCCDVIQETFKDSTMESFQTLYQRSYVPKGWNTGFMNAAKGTDIYLYTRNALEIDRRQYSNKVAYDSMYVMKECFLPLNVAFGMRKQSPLKESINLKLKQLQEAGIVSKYVKEGHEMTAKSSELGIHFSREVKETDALDTSHLQGVFQLGLILLAVALIAFLFEIAEICAKGTKRALKSVKQRLQRFSQDYNHIE